MISAEAAAAGFDCACRRRAFARRSRIPRSEDSSIHSGAASSSLQARSTFGQSFVDLSLAQPVAGDPRPAWR